MEKRVSCRAIIIENGGLVTMYREKADRVYYTFPGGGINEGETETHCVIREVEEEFGINVTPLKKVYMYENDKTVQNFYLCKWISGELGTGEGEEFQPDRNRGIYLPTLMPIEKIKDLPLMPDLVANQLVLDIEKYGENLGDEMVTIKE